MKGKKIYYKTITAILAVLTISSGLAVFVNAQTTTNATTNNNLLQYEWPQLGCNGGWQLFSSGPAPDNPDVLWSTSVTGLSQSNAVPGLSATVTAFDGKVFVGVAGSVNKVFAFNAFTGQQIWNTSVYMPQSAPTKLDDTYCFVDGDLGEAGLGYAPVNTTLNYTITVLRTSDGSVVKNFTLPNIAYTPGAGGYFPGVYDAQTHMKYVRGYNYQTNEIAYYGIDLTDPTNPKVGWKTVFNQAGEELAAAAGINWIGTVNGDILAFNSTTGRFMYEARKIGFAQYGATYIDGVLIQAAASTTLTAYNATTGEILWDNEQGGRAFFSYPGAAAYGRYYACNVAVPNGYVGCWDIQTGNLLWKQPAVYNFGYNMPVVADGKVYIQRYNGAAGGAVTMPNTFSCFDAFTGDLLWELPNTLIMDPSVAYGNLYGIIGNTIYCFSNQATQDWSMWRGNTANPGIIQASGPANISLPVWTFNTAGSISGSPAAVAGKVYFGSRDGNIHCLDAYDGNQLWNFTTDMPVLSSPAVSNGVVYTGSDDGNVYALDANTGQMKWTTHLTDITTFVAASTWQPRSSPILVGSRLYIGALDGFLYCLDITTGNVLWRGPTSGNASFPIAGSAAYSDGTVYISCTDHCLYALNAQTGALIWKTQSNATMGRAYTGLFPWSTPVVFDNMVYWGAGPVYGRLIWYALNATDGEQIWNVNGSMGRPSDTTFGGNTPTCQTPVLLQWNTSLSVMIVPENLGVSVRNAKDGTLISYQFLGHEVYSSICYANDMQGPKMYVGCDTYSVTCLNATAMIYNETANMVLSVFTTESEVQSSATVWEGKLFVGSTDGNMYMFSDEPRVQMSVFATVNKGAEMWNNETLTISGKLQPAVNVVNIGGSSFGTFNENGLPNATVNVSLTRPDLTSVNLTATTDAFGYFTISYSLTEVGNWGWVAYYAGQEKQSIVYNEVYSEWNTVSVVAAPIENPPTTSATITPETTATPETIVTLEPTATPQETGTNTTISTPIEYIYLAVVVTVLIAIAIGTYVYSRKTKK